MGQYEPEDSRDVTLTDGHEPGGIRRTGPREGETRQNEQGDRWSHEGEGARPGDQQQALDAQTGGPRPEYDQYEVNQAGNINNQAQAQRGYGNARDEDGQMKQDIATSDHGKRPLAQDEAQPDETSSRPDERAAADANRPLGKD